MLCFLKKLTASCGVVIGADVPGITWKTDRHAQDTTAHIIYPTTPTTHTPILHLNSFIFVFQIGFIVILKECHFTSPTD